MRPTLQRVLAEPDGTTTLAAIVDLVRPTDNRRNTDAGAGIRALVAVLATDSELATRFRDCLRGALAGLRIVHALVEGGIIPDKRLWEGIRGRLGEAVLPSVHADDDLRAVLPRVFTKSNDWEWVRAVPSADWTALFELVLDPGDVEGVPHDDIGAAIRALAQRVGAAGIDEEVNARLAYVEDYDSPFLDLTVTAHEFLEDHRHGVGTVASFDALVTNVAACREIVRTLRDRKTYGTSLRMTRLTRRMMQQLRRLELLLHLVHPADLDDFAVSLAPLLKELLEAHQAGDTVRRHVGQSVDLWAYQITEHTAKKGEKYVARTAGAYWRFLLAAMSGGAIVAVFAVAKLFLSKLSLPLAAQAFVYGINYSICFVLIYLTGSILATKQPAITASAIARRLDEASSRREALESVADTVVLVWRSQFVSFVGNLLCAFPVAILIAWGLEHALAMEAADVTKAESLLVANHPWESNALFYAAIAGVFLFSAGVIQGAVDNRIVYTRLGQRLSNHPRLAFVGRARQRLVDGFVNNAGGIASNTALGFMLGSAGVVGVILGLPIDIRHIAFSSSHVGVATLDAPQLFDANHIYYVLLGIIGIGLINFLVSFGLTMMVTLKSRKVTFNQSGALLVLLIKRFFTRPLDWFLPVGDYSEQREQPSSQ